MKPYEPEKKGSLIELPSQVKERMSMVEQRAIVVAVGSEAWVKETQPRAAVGDHVMISRYAGIVAQGPKDGKEYRLVNDNDVFCGLEAS